MDYEAQFGKLLDTLPGRGDLRNGVHQRNQAALDDYGSLLALARNAAAETVHLEIATRLVATNNRARANLAAVLAEPVLIAPPAIPQIAARPARQSIEDLAEHFKPSEARS